jgi:hypothetical protein
VGDMTSTTDDPSIGTRLWWAPSENETPILLEPRRLEKSTDQIDLLVQLVELRAEASQETSSAILVTPSTRSSSPSA